MENSYGRTPLPTNGGSGSRHAPDLLPESLRRPQLLDLAAGLLDRHWNALPDRTIGPFLSDEQIEAALSAVNFEKPKPLMEVVEQATMLLAGGMVHCAHPRHFGLFVPSPSFAGVLGELIGAGLNMQLASESYAPAAVAAERKVLGAFADRLGLGECSGHFTSGGSEANMTGAVVALTRAYPRYSEIGLQVLTSPPVLYVSRDAHSCWFKIAHQLGLGRQAVCVIETDGAGKMNVRRLRHAIARGRSEGKAPFLLVATAGTTNAGMIDPLAECAQVAREEGLWLHVDAAWGGGVAASDEARHILAGIEQADSITLDPHKLLSMPMGCGIFLSRHSGAIGQSFRASGSYMPRSDADEPYSNSVQWSRRCIGLGLFLSLASVGWRGHGATVDRQLELAESLREALRLKGFHVLNRSQLGVACFQPPVAADVKRLARAVQQRGRCWITAAEFEGLPVLRACVTSFRTGPDDIAALVQELNEVLI